MEPSTPVLAPAAARTLRVQQLHTTRYHASTATNMVSRVVYAHTLHVLLGYVVSLLPLRTSHTVTSSCGCATCISADDAQLLRRSVGTAVPYYLDVH